jgi:hypothetical protein
VHRGVQAGIEGHRIVNNDSNRRTRKQCWSKVTIDVMLNKKETKERGGGPQKPMRRPPFLSCPAELGPMCGDGTAGLFCAKKSGILTAVWVTEANPSVPQPRGLKAKRNKKTGRIGHMLPAAAEAEHSRLATEPHEGSMQSTPPSLPGGGTIDV